MRKFSIYGPTDAGPDGYRCWPDQAAFHRELAIAAVGWRDEAPIAETVAHIRGLVDTRAPLGEVIRVAAEANLFRYPEKTALLDTITPSPTPPTPTPYDLDPSQP